MENYAVEPKKHASDKYKVSFRSYCSVYLNVQFRSYTILHDFPIILCTLITVMV